MDNIDFDLCLQQCLLCSVRNDLKELKLIIGEMSVSILTKFKEYINFADNEDTLENIKLYEKLRSDIRRI